MTSTRGTISRYRWGGSDVFALTWTRQPPSLNSMSDFTDSRRSFLRSCAMGVAGLVVSGAVSRSEGLLAALGWRRIFTRDGYIGQRTWSLMEKTLGSKEA